MTDAIPLPDEQQEQAQRMAARLGEQAQAAANVLAEAVRPSIPAIKRLADALAMRDREA
jgi:hypothetical protein